MRGNLPQIALVAFPQLEVSKFISVNGGHKFQGPCPFCGGTDRFVIWLYLGQWFARCTQNEHFTRKNGDHASSTSLTNYTGKVTSREDRQKFLEWDRNEKIRIEKERMDKLLRLNQPVREMPLCQEMPLWKTFHNKLLKSPRDIEYLLTSGISMDSIKKFRLGLNPAFYYEVDGVSRMGTALTFPTFRRFTLNKVDRVWCTNIRHRIYGLDKKKYRPVWKGLNIDYFRCYQNTKDYVLILEGEKKAIVTYQQGFNTVGLWGVQTWRELWIKEFRKFPEQFIIFDHEEDSEKQESMVTFALRLRQSIGRTARVIVLPTIGKIDDLFVAGKLSREDILWFIEKGNNK